MLVFFWPFRCWQETGEKLWFFWMSSFSAGANKIKDLAVGKEKKKKTKSRVTNNKSWQSSVEKKKRASYRSGRSEYAPCLFSLPPTRRNVQSCVCLMRMMTLLWAAWPNETSAGQLWWRLPYISNIFKNKNKTKTQCQKTGGPVPY